MNLHTSDRPTSLPARIFTCPACGAALTPPVRALPPALDLPDRPGVVHAVGHGCWVARPDARCRPAHPIAVNVDALSTGALRLHDDRHRAMGCCGPGFRDGQPNLCCVGCGAEVGMLLADGNHVAHAVYLADHAVEAEVPGLTDEVVARRMARGALLAPAPGEGTLPAALLGNDGWNDDLDRLLDVLPVVRRVTATLTPHLGGRRLWLRLDDASVRPPWSAPELAVIAALGALPLGGVLQPWIGRIELPVGVDEWQQGVVGDRLCVLWNRHVPPGPAFVLGFQVDVAEWTRAGLSIG